MFFSSPPSYIGVDIGASAIKIVELTNDQGRPRLVTYGIAEHHKALLGNFDPRQSPTDVAIALKSLLSKSRVTTTKVIASLPSFSVFTSMVTIPLLEKKDTAAAVRWEAKKIIPLPIEEMVLDWKILEDHEWRSRGEQVGVATALTSEQIGEREPVPAPVESPTSNAGKTQRVLVTAAARQLVKKYIDIFKAAGLELLSLETEAFALLRSLIGYDQSVIMIVDIGAINTDITVVDHGIPLLNRSIDTGGVSLTQAIANQMHMSLDEAEQFKRDWSRETHEQVPPVIEQALMPIMNEMKYCSTLYDRQIEALLGIGSATMRQGAHPSIEKIILTGGSAYFSFLEQCFKNHFPIAVAIGNPWARVSFPKDLQKQLYDIGPRSSIAIGLAMRNIE